VWRGEEVNGWMGEEFFTSAFCLTTHDSRLTTHDKR